MNKATFLFCVTAALLVSIAEATVSGVTCKQRWPFSGKVDVDFTLTSSEPQDILFKFTYTGQRDEPKAITNRWLDATVYGATNGVNHFVFDPAEYGVGDRSLPGLTVEPVWATNVSERLYLVLDITNGAYEFLNETPANGWTQAVYKSSKMPFRRVAKGNYTLGHSEADLKHAKSGVSSMEKKSMGSRLVTLGSDYYIAIFPLTGAQYYYSAGGTSTDYYYRTMTYDGARGNTNEVAELNVNWPYTGVGEVLSTSWVGKMNTKLAGRAVLDLPTDAQYEVAIRAGTTTYFFNGGDSTTSTTVMSNLWTQFSYPGNKEHVGLRQPNQWNIYNPQGMAYYWCLDAVSTSQYGWKDNINAGPAGLDPVGEKVPVGSPMQRVAHGNGYSSGTGLGALAGYRRTAPPAGSSYTAAVRPVLHLADPRDDL